MIARAYPWLFALLGFSIPITTAGSNLFLALAFFAALALPERRARLLAYREHPVARAALLLFGVLLLSCLHGEVAAFARAEALWKYFDLLLIGLFLPLLAAPDVQRKALWGFAASQGLTLAISTLFWLGLLPDGLWRTGHGSPSATVFKLHIQQSWLMALFALLCLLVARAHPDRRWRLGLYATAGLAVINILFMVQGRTGYLMVAVLGLYGLVVAFRWRGLLAAALAGGLIASAGFQLSPQLASGVSRAVADVRAWDPRGAAPITSSQGLRLDFWVHTLPIVAAHPLGVGTGSFTPAFARQVEGTAVIRTNNPHQQYLLTAAEAGLPGLAALLFLFWTVWRAAGRLDPTRRDLARGLLLATAVGCLFNSFLLDHTEGMFFAWASAVLFGTAFPPRLPTAARPQP